MHAVIGVLAQRDLFFIDSKTNAASVGEATARAMGVPTAARDVFLDNRADVAYSEAQLRRRLRSRSAPAAPSRSVIRARRRWRPYER